eukprot:GHVT01053691.1.p1 GENE.GHVT01053691.1~~GHVT01053691.1.p1  ORF type:complete len:322 (+),score=26.75 GHVT01053691.1:1784-2749(+)
MQALCFSPCPPILVFSSCLSSRHVCFLFLVVFCDICALFCLWFLDCVFRFEGTKPNEVCEINSSYSFCDNASKNDCDAYFGSCQDIATTTYQCSCQPGFVGNGKEGQCLCEDETTDEAQVVLSNAANQVGAKKCNTYQYVSYNPSMVNSDPDAYRSARRTDTMGVESQTLRGARQLPPPKENTKANIERGRVSKTYWTIILQFIRLLRSAADCPSGFLRCLTSAFFVGVLLCPALGRISCVDDRTYQWRMFQVHGFNDDTPSWITATVVIGYILLAIVLVCVIRGLWRWWKRRQGGYEDLDDSDEDDEAEEQYDLEEDKGR